VEYVAGYLASSWLLCGCFLDAFCTLSCFLLWRLCATMNALSECLLFAVVLVLLRMLFAVGYVAEYVVEHVVEYDVEYVSKDVVGYVVSCWVAV
jgi:hypothetical protein